MSQIESYDTSIPIYTEYMSFDILQLILRHVACFQPYLFYPRPTNDVQPLSFFPSINEQEIELRKKVTLMSFIVDVYADTHIRPARPIDLDDKTRTTTLDIQSRFDNELVFAR